MGAFSPRSRSRPRARRRAGAGLEVLWLRSAQPHVVGPRDQVRRPDRDPRHRGQLLGLGALAAEPPLPRLLALRDLARRRHRPARQHLRRRLARGQPLGQPALDRDRARGLHAGAAASPRRSTDASARLVAYLAARAGMPVDRRHVIGHAEVPHPSGRGVGGVDHHTDPGKQLELEALHGPRPEVLEEPGQAYVHAPDPEGRGAAGCRSRGRSRRSSVPARSSRASRSGTSRASGGSGAAASTASSSSSTGSCAGATASARSRSRAAGAGTRAPSRTAGTCSRPRSTAAAATGCCKRFPVRVNNTPIELALDGVAPEGGARGEVTIDVTPVVPRARVSCSTSTASPSAATARRRTGCTGTRPRAAEGPHELLVYGRTAGGRRAAPIVPVVVANGDLPPTARPRARRARRRT